MLTTFCILSYFYNFVTVIDIVCLVWFGNATYSSYDNDPHAVVLTSFPAVNIHTFYNLCIIAYFGIDWVAPRKQCAFDRWRYFVNLFVYICEQHAIITN